MSYYAIVICIWQKVISMGLISSPGNTTPIVILKYQEKVKHRLISAEKKLKP